MFDHDLILSTSKNTPGAPQNFLVYCYRDIEN